MNSHSVNLVDQLVTRNPDMRKRRVVNASPSQDLNDYVIRQELLDAVQLARTELAAAVSRLEDSLAALAALDFVYGGSNLTTDGAIPKVSTVDGTLDESSINDSGTTVSIGLNTDVTGNVNVSGIYKVATVAGVTGTLSLSVSTVNLQYKDWAGTNQTQTVVTNVTITGNAFTGGIRTT